MPKLVIEDDGTRRIYEILDERVTIGRDPGVDLRLRDEAVAPRHLILTRRGVAFRIAAEPDADFTVNGEAGEDRTLLHGDRLQVGGVTLQFLEDDLPPPPPPPEPAVAPAAEPANRAGDEPAEPGPAAPAASPSLADLADDLASDMRMRHTGPRTEKRERKPAPRRTARSLAMISTSLLLSATVILVMVKFLSSDTFGKGPGYLFNLAQVEASRGNFERALSFLKMASERSPDTTTAQRIQSLREKINKTLARGGDDQMLASAQQRRMYLEKFEKVYLGRDPSRRPACRALVRRVDEWLATYRDLCRKYPTHAEDIAIVEGMRTRYAAAAHLDQPDDVDDVLFRAKLSVRRDHRRYAEAVRMLDDYLAQPSAPRADEVQKRRDEMVSEGDVWVRQFLRKVDKMIRRGDFSDAAKEIDFLRAEGLSHWAPTIDEAAGRLEAAKSRRS